LTRIELIGLRRCAAFGAILMGSIGTWLVCGDYFGNSERFTASAIMIVGMDVPCPILAGIAGGALAVWLTRTRQHNPA
jgi:hypothetical protein